MFFVIIIIIIDITIIVIAFLLSSGKDDNLCRLAEFKWYHLIESLSQRSKQKSCLFIYFFRSASDYNQLIMVILPHGNGLWETAQGGTAAPRSRKSRGLKDPANKNPDG